MACGGVPMTRYPLAGVQLAAGYLAILAAYAVALLAIASLRLRRSLVTP